MTSVTLDQAREAVRMIIHLVGEVDVLDGDKRLGAVQVNLHPAIFQEMRDLVKAMKKEAKL